MGAAEMKVKEEATAAAAKKKEEEEEAGAKKKAEEEQAAAEKKKEEEEQAAAAAAARVKAADEVRKEEEKKKEQAAMTVIKPKSKLASLLSKQVVKEESPNKLTLEDTAAPSSSIVSPASITATPTTTSTNGKSRRHVYSKEELQRLRSLPVCQVRPTDLAEFIIAKGASAVRGGPGGSGGGPGAGGHNRGDRGERRQSRGGGGGGSWERGAAPPQRRDPQPNNQHQNNDGGGGGQWARGKAPPPQQQHQGGRGGGRGGRGGGRGGGQQQPFFDGPVVPLTESKNGWRPKKNTGPLVIAEKKIKSILNKMTKEKFDRLSQQIIDIPVTSYQILTLMISKVYEKGIDEPYLGDMYGDLCVRMSLHVQSNSFVQIIESNEEPPTEDGEPAPATTGGDAASNFSVFRWSHDVSTDDSDIVGPFTSVEDCMKMALSSDEQQDPVERGDVELELVKLQLMNGVFIKVLKKKKKKKPDDEEKKKKTPEQKKKKKKKKKS